jgi:hypothetical protein
MLQKKKSHNGAPSPFSGCFCYKNFFIIGRIPDFVRNHNSKFSGASEYPEESFFRKTKSQKKVETSEV